LFIIIGALFYSLKFDVGVCVSDELEERWGILTDDCLGVVAANIVPDNAILVHVIQHTQTGLRRLVNIEFSVVRLSPLEVASSAPRLVSPAIWLLVRLGKFDSRARPEPSVDNQWLEIFTIVAAFKVAQPST